MSHFELANTKILDKVADHFKVTGKHKNEINIHVMFDEREEDDSFDHAFGTERIVNKKPVNAQLLIEFKKGFIFKVSKFRHICVDLALENGIIDKNDYESIYEDCDEHISRSNN